MTANYLTKLIILISSISILLIAPIVAKSQEQTGISLTAEAGFDGYFKENHIIPVRVTAENTGPSVDGFIQIHMKRPDNSEALYSYPVSLPTTSRKEITLFVFPETFFISRNLKVSLNVGNDEVASTSAPIDAIRYADDLYGVWAASPSAFNRLTDLKPSNGRHTYVAQLNQEDLPERSPALSGLDVLVISNVDTGVLSAAKVQSIKNWVAAGGQLVITTGPDWQKTVQGLRELLPISPKGTQTIQNLSAVQAFANSPADLVGEAVILSGDLLPEALVLLESDGYPVVVQKSTGSGNVYFLSIDPSLEPFRSWDGLESFYRQLLASESKQPSWAFGFQNYDYAAQAIATLPDLAAPSTWLFCGFLALYVAALGPVNYFFLRKLKRRELAWLSIPGLVIFFSILSFIIGSQMRGNKPVLNQLALVQVWPDNEYARVDGLVGIFSPRRDTYQIEFESQFLVHPIPSQNSITGRNWSFQQEENRVTIPRLRTEVGGMQAVAIRGSVPAPVLKHELEWRAVGQTANLEGTLTNQSALALQDAVLITPDKSHRLGEIKPGETKNIEITNLSAAQPPNAGQRSNNTPQNSPIPVNPPFNQGIDILATDILGTGSFYQDKEINRRYTFITSLLSSGVNSPAPGEGIYLFGWAENSPVDVKVAGEKPDTTSLSLYVFTLVPSTIP